MSKLKIKQEGRNSWWVQNIDDTQYEWCGPYKNREEAVEAREGLERTRETPVWRAIEREWIEKAKIKIKEKTDEPAQSKSLLSGLGGLFPPMG